MPTVEPIFAIGEIAYTKWGKPVTIEGLQILTFVTYRADDEYWQEEELSKGPTSCHHTDQDKPANFFGTSNPP